MEILTFIGGVLVGLICSKFCKEKLVKDENGKVARDSKGRFVSKK